MGQHAQRNRPRGPRWLPRVGLLASSIGVHGLLLALSPGPRRPQVAPVVPPLESALVVFEHGPPGAGEPAGAQIAQLAATVGPAAAAVEPTRDPPVPEPRTPKPRARSAAQRSAPDTPEVAEGLLVPVEARPEEAPPEDSEGEEPEPAAPALQTPVPDAVEPPAAPPSPSTGTADEGVSGAGASGADRGVQGNGLGTESGAGRGQGMGASRAAVLRAYLLRVRDQVAAHRRYPSLARRHGIEGLVRVRLRVDGRGRVSDVRIASGADSELLRSGARWAVAAAAPLPAVPAVLGTELRIEVPVAFRIDR